MTSQLVNAHLQITGYVQGVFFRANTYQEAISRGITGWVRNRHDGSVEAVIQGSKHKVEEMIEYSRHGPPGASVSGVKVTWQPIDESLSTFSIESSC